MRQIKWFIKRFLSWETILFSALVLAMNSVAYFGSRIFSEGKIHYDLSIAVDNWIPFWPAMVVIYIGSYIFWGLSYITIIGYSHESAVRFSLSEITGKIVCLIFYVWYPTTMQRAQLAGNGIFMDMMRFLYRVDAADNLFPSIHCYVSWMCYLGIRDKKDFPRWYKLFAFVCAVAICLSTVTVKQHVIVDVAAGIVLAELVYRLGLLDWKKYLFKNRENR